MHNPNEPGEHFRIGDAPEIAANFWDRHQKKILIGLGVVAALIILSAVL